MKPTSAPGSGLDLNIPESIFRGNNRDDVDDYVQQGLRLWMLMQERLAIETFADKRVLDVGCGTKLVQSLFKSNLALGSYTGVDVSPPIINALKSEVDDPRLEFHVFDIHNEMYNHNGQPLTSSTKLPVDGKFDVICLFSVFTHLVPSDYENMLKVLRNYIHADGQLIFSLYIDEPTEGGHGLIDQVMRDSGLDWHPPKEKFRDAHTSPLHWALYSREYAEELVSRAGWRIVGNHQPQEVIQHHFVCRPEA